jgi:DNA-binding CsgD family transcriptional regulator
MTHLRTLNVGRTPCSHLELIDAIGDEGFGSRTINYLNRLCGADHFAAFNVREDRVEAMAEGSVDPENIKCEPLRRYMKNDWWRRDPAMSEAMRLLSMGTPSIFRIDLSDCSYSQMRPYFFRRMEDRVVACTQYNKVGFGLTVMRSSPHGIFEKQEINRLADATEWLAPLIIKHYSLWRIRRCTTSLSSLEQIEKCIFAMSDLPRREAEVSARILYGHSTVSAASDLGIGHETVKEYRKRTYRRLKIVSERELLTWYLTIWRSWHLRYFDA